MGRIHYQNEPERGISHQVLFSEVHAITNLDKPPFVFRFDVLFTGTEKSTRNFKMKVYELEGTEVLAVLKLGDLEAMRALVAEYKP